jgi:hypothetical protein
MEDAALPSVLVLVALGTALGALRCLADHLLVSALFYCLAAAAAAGSAAKLALDRL